MKVPLGSVRGQSFTLEANTGAVLQAYWFGYDRWLLGGVWKEAKDTQIGGSLISKGFEEATRAGRKGDVVVGMAGFYALNILSSIPLRSKNRGGRGAGLEDGSEGGSFRK